MTQIVEAPAELDIETPQGDPFSQLFAIALTGVTWSSLTWAVEVLAASEEAPGVVGPSTRLAPTVTLASTGSSSGTLKVVWSAAQTALGPEFSDTTWVVNVTFTGGDGPYEVLAGELTLSPPGEPGTASEGALDVSLNITDAAGNAVTFAITTVN